MKAKRHPVWRKGNATHVINIVIRITLYTHLISKVKLLKTASLKAKDCFVTFDKYVPLYLQMVLCVGIKVIWISRI